MERKPGARYRQLERLEVAERRVLGFTYRLGSMDFPAEFFRSFFNVAGPMFRRWSALGLVMMLSQMTAEFVVLSGPGQSAVT